MSTFFCVFLVFLFSLSAGIDLDGFVTMDVLKQTSFQDGSLFIRSLEKDTLRSRSIASQISEGPSRSSDLKHMSSANVTNWKEFSIPLVSGASTGYANYMVEIGVGTPPKLAYLIADTGSAVTWLQCAPCKYCYKQHDPIFIPESSTSYRLVNCRSLQCRKLQVKSCYPQGACMYKVNYGNGSFSTGHFSTETLMMGRLFVTNIGIGCGHDNEGMFSGSDGVCGLSRGLISLPFQLGSSFSYCLPKLNSRNESALSFGGSRPKTATVTHLVDNWMGLYYLTLTGIHVGGAPVRTPTDTFSFGPDGTGGFILDTATAITRLHAAVYTPLRDAFRTSFAVKDVFGYHMFDTCYKLKGLDQVKVPSVMFEFEGDAKMELPPSNIMISVSHGIYCLAFVAEESSFNIIGNVQQQTFGFYIDNGKKEVGIVPNLCS